MMRWRPLTCAVVIAGATIASSVPLVARASNYDLSSIDLVDEALLARLAEAKVRTTLDLFEATRTPRQAAAMARKVQVSPSRVRDWHDFCDLLRIKGLGPKVVRVLHFAGIRRAKELAGKVPADATRLIKTTNAQYQILGKLPDEDTVRDWIDQAKRLPPK